jgi:glutathionyl-hydroquinone reductase
MGMLIDGVWQDDVDRFMVDGAFQRETSSFPSAIGADVIEALRVTPERFVLVASFSCPWSHGAVLAWMLKGFSQTVAVQRAGGKRVEGYGLLRGGPLSGPMDICHMHQLYSASDAAFTGRATVPMLWDRAAGRGVSNSSADIMLAFDGAGDGDSLYPSALAQDIDGLIVQIFDGLSNAVYRAGLAERQDAYDGAIEQVFGTLDWLETRLSGQRYLFGDQLTLADLRLFATLVRFDTVYATHFRCTRKRIVDYPSLWRFARRMYQMVGVKQTVDFEDIIEGYYVNDGSHNPFGLIGAQPVIDWDDTTDL